MTYTATLTRKAVAAFTAFALAATLTPTLGAPQEAHAAVLLRTAGNRPAFRTGCRFVPEGAERHQRRRRPKGTAPV